MTERVLVDVQDNIATVTLNRPEKYNALDRQMFDDIGDAGDALAGRSDVRAVVLTGAGGNFSAGIDISGFGGQDLVGSFADEAFALHGNSPANRYQRPAWVWHALPIPVIAAIDGVCFGGGMQIAAGADIRIGAPASRYSIMEIKWGLVPDMGFTAVMRDVMRLDHLKQLAYTGRIVESAEAARYGLISEVANDALSSAMSLAEEIAGKSPDAIRATKHLIHEAWQTDKAAALHFEASAQLAVMGDKNQVEAVMANMQKRPPAFSNASVDLKKIN
ncbi:MAG: crotonase/enoyl-CoA hydratase family protein [Pseudomonadota bacterium]